MYTKQSQAQIAYDTVQTGKNPVTTENTTDRERAELLLLFTTVLPVDPLLMPLKPNERGPIITGNCRLDSKEARSYLDTPKQAAKEIRENGVRGYYIYAGKPSHNTQSLIFSDEDKPQEWPELDETLRIVSGSGTGIHRYWINDGWDRGSDGKKDLEGIGGVLVRNTGVVVPGSIHHETNGIYHIVNAQEPVPLSPDDVPEGLQPSSNSVSGDHSYEELDESDEEAVETVQQAIIGFRTNTQTSRKAVEYFEDLREGNNLREQGFIPDDPENKKGCRHEANVALASKLHGILLMNGETDKERNKNLIHQYLRWIAQQYPYTDGGQPRKLKLGDWYIRERVSVAIETFSHKGFSKWMKKTKGNNFTGEYSPIMKERVLMVTEMLAESNDQYPSKSQIVKDCYKLDDSRTKESYGKCLRNMVGEKVKQGHFGGNDYRYFPIGMKDPENARSIEPEPIGW